MLTAIERRSHKKIRLPKEERGGTAVETEQHFITQCPKLQPVHEQFSLEFIIKNPCFINSENEKLKIALGETDRTVCLCLPQNQRESD